MQVVARAVLRGAGADVDEAENGAEAVRLVRERIGGGGGGAYDLILTDRQMPVMDGHEVTQLRRPVDSFHVCVLLLARSGRKNAESLADEHPAACMQATRGIRAMGVATPIVAVSSDCLPSDVHAFTAAGADDFTPKVIDLSIYGYIYPCMQDAARPGYLSDRLIPPDMHACSR